MGQRSGEGLQGSEVRRGTPGVGGEERDSRGRRSGLGCLQAGEDGEDEVPERRVLSDEESRGVGVCVLQTHNIHDLHHTQPQHHPPLNTSTHLTTKCTISN